MARREGETALTGRVEMDDAYLGGVRPAASGAAARRARRPSWRRSTSLKLPVKGFRKREIARGAKHWLAPGAAVVTDGLGCWSALDEIACSHQAIRTGSGRQAARMAPFKWVNTTLGNIKCAITGTYRKLGPDHAGRYLASFAWRYNRRYQLETMIPRFGGQTSKPIDSPSCLEPRTRLRPALRYAASPLLRVRVGLQEANNIASSRVGAKRRIEGRPVAPVPSKTDRLW